MITKQDIQKIVTVLSKQAVKDSQFPAAKPITGTESVAIVLNNANKLASIVQLVDYVSKKVGIEDAVITVPGWTDKDGSTMSGPLKMLLSSLYTLAISPRDENGEPITADSLNYINDVSDSFNTVAGALTYIIDQLPDKADLTNNTGTLTIPYKYLPPITLQNIEPVATCPASSGMWFKTDHKLYYRYNGEDILLGTPVDMLYFYNGDVYHYNTANYKFDRIDYLKRDSATNRLTYDAMSHVVLESLDIPAASILNQRRAYYYYNPNSDKIIYHKTNLNTVEYEPSEGVLYCVESTGVLYIYKKDSTTKWIAVGNTEDLSGKADLIGTTRKILKPLQWPKVVINNIDDDLDENEGEGDVIFNTSNQHLYLIDHYDDNTNTVLTDLGLPQQGTIYCLKSTNELYRWTGSVLGNPWQKISSGTEEPVDISGKADLESNVDMLSVSQWPQVIISSVSRTTDQEARANLSVGQLFVKELQDGSDGLFMLSGTNRIIPVDISNTTVYYAVDTKKFYIYNGQRFVPATPESITLNSAYKIPAEYCHILTVASLGYRLDNIGIVEGETPFVYSPVAGDYYASVNDFDYANALVYYREDDNNSVSTGFLSEHSIVFNCHTGRYYYTNDSGRLVEYPINGIQLEPSGHLPLRIMPKVVLDSMNFVHRNMIPLGVAGETHFCTDGKIRYYYTKKVGNETALEFTTYDPVPGILYANKTTNSLYYWDTRTSSFIEIVKNNETPPVAVGDADIVVDETNKKIIFVLPFNFSKPVLTSPAESTQELLIAPPNTYIDFQVLGTGITSGATIRLATGKTFKISKADSQNILSQGFTLTSNEINEGTMIRVTFSTNMVISSSLIYSDTIIVTSDTQEFTQRYVSVTYKSYGGTSGTEPGVIDTGD